MLTATLHKPSLPRRLFHAWNRLSLMKKGYLVLSVPILALVMSTWMLLTSQKMETRARLKVDHTIKVIDAINKTNMDIFRAASAVYAKFTINEPGAMERYAEGKRRTLNDLETIRALSRNNPTQLASAEAASAIFARRLELAERLADHPDPLRGLPDVVEEGRSLMLEGLRKLADMRAEETRMLANHRRDLDEAKANIRLSVGANFIFGLGGGVLAMFLFISSNIKRIHRLEETAQALSPDFRPGDNHESLDEIGRLDLVYQEAARLKQEHERELLEHMERFKAIADYTYDWENWFSPEGKLLWINPAVERITGYSIEECQAMDRFPLPFIHPGDRERIQETFIQAQGGSHGKDEEFRLVRKDGATIWTSVSWQPIFDREGNNLGHRSSVRDITGRKESEEELRATKDRLSQASRELDAVLSSVQDYIYMLDREGRFAFANKQLLDLWGLPAEEAVGKTMHELGYPEEVERTISEGMAEVFRTGKAVTNQTHYTSPSTGEAAYYENVLAPVADADGAIAHVAGASRNITSTNLLMAELRKAKDMADAANTAKTTFLANMSHEIRTPLNGIVGMLSLLQGSSLTPRQAEFTDTALKSSDRLTRLLSDILDLSRIEVGMLEIVDEPFDLREAITSIEQMYGPVARNKGLEFRLEMAPDLPGPLSGDTVRLQQILGNLIGNAIKFTEQGYIRVSVSLLTPQEADTGSLLLIVEDTGIGLDVDKLELLFEPFTQAETDYVRQYQGAGLGLAITKKLVGLMNGTLTVSSEPGKGSIFLISLPINQAGPGEGADESGDESGTTEGGLNLLMAEDDEINRFAQQLLLEKYGYRVVAVEDGRQVLEALKAQDGPPFDLVLMDIQMPEMDGMEATRAIRRGDAGEAVKDIPIVALTAYAMTGDREKFLAQGLNGYVTKPLNREDLQRVITEAMRGDPPETA